MPPAKPRRRTVSSASIVVSAAIVLGIVLTIRMPALGYGILTALGATLLPGYLAVVMFRGRRSSPQAQRTTLAMLVGFPVAAVAVCLAVFPWQTAVAAAATALALLYVMVFRAYFGSLAKVRTVAALRRALAAGDAAAVTTIVDKARAWRTAVVFQVVAALSEHARTEEAEALAAQLPVTPALMFDRAVWLVGLRLARKDLAGARAAITEVPRERIGDVQRPVIDLLEARVRIGEGKAKEVAKELAEPPAGELAPAILDMRDLVRADARVETGDKLGAATLLREVVARKRQSLAALAKTGRPLAQVAQSIIKRDQIAI